MHIRDIISLGKEYLVLGIVAAIVLAAAFLVGYFVIYKKIMRGQKRLSIFRLGWLAVFACYLVVVFGTTLLSRGNFWGRSVVSLFYTYKDAWVNADVSAWRNIVLNILLFVPFGFLLPLGVKWFRNFGKTCVAGFLLTLVIELYQLKFSMGIFEVADLVHNTLGAMIGYGLWSIGVQIGRWRKKEKGSVGKVLLLQLPFAFALIWFGGIYFTYQMQELGNLRGTYIEAYDAEKIFVESSIEYSDRQTEIMVYQVPILSEEEAGQMAENFFAHMGTNIDESRTDLYDETAFYWAEDSYNMVIEYLGGTYSITDFDTLFGEDRGGAKPNEIFDADEETVRDALLQYSIDVPAEAVFAVQDGRGYCFTYEQIMTADAVLDGVMTCRYYDNGKLGDIDYRVVEAKAYKEFAIISEQDAFEKIVAGEFACWGNEQLQIKLGKVTMEYMTDSKGFYQPVYGFAAEINGQETTIMVPAIP